MVRKVEVTDATAGIWGALEEMMAMEMQEGTFEDTVVVIHWSGKTPSFGIGVHEDADMFDFDLMAERDHSFGRRYAVGGGTGMRVPATPLISIWYQKADGTIQTESDLNGEANEDALHRFGLDAEYRPIGDTEILLDEMRYKILAGAAATLDQHYPGYWLITDSIVWDTPPEETAELYEEAINLPPEKFEDKDTDKATARIRDISGIFDQLGKDIDRDEVVDALVEAKVANIFGQDEPIHEYEFRPEEQAYIDRMVPFFESDPWINRVSTTRLLNRVSPDFDVGIGAHKSRKLIKTTVVLDDSGRISESLFTGDMYIRPHPTITTRGVLAELEDAIIGLDPTDFDALESALGEAFDEHDVEAPGLDSGDFARSVVKASSSTQPVSEYLAQRE